MSFYCDCDRRPILAALFLHLLIVSVPMLLAVLERQQVSSVHSFIKTESALMISIADTSLVETGAHAQTIVDDLLTDIPQEAVKSSEAEIPNKIVRRPLPMVRQVKETLHGASKRGDVVDGQESVSRGDVEHEAFARPQHHLNPPPDYPVMLRQRGIEGTVWLRVRVDRAGLPEQIVLFKTSGYRLFDEAALRAVARWRFKPARSQGTTMVSWVEFPVRFTLQG